MPRRLDVRKGHPILLDGHPLNSSLARIEPRSEPFPLFLWDGRERLYDVDLYEEGELVGTVPPKSIYLDADDRRNEPRFGALASPSTAAPTLARGRVRRSVGGVL